MDSQIAAALIGVVGGILVAVLSPMIANRLSTPKDDKDNPETLYRAVEKFLQQFNNNMEEGDYTNIISIVNDTLEYVPESWIKFLLIRMTLRRLLIDVGTKHGLLYKNLTTGMEKRAADLYGKGIIGPQLFDQINNIREATFVFEWATGKIPTIQEIKFVLENYEKVFDALNKLAHP